MTEDERGQARAASTVKSSALLDDLEHVTKLIAEIQAKRTATWGAGRAAPPRGVLEGGCPKCGGDVDWWFAGGRAGGAVCRTPQCISFRA